MADPLIPVVLEPANSVWESKVDLEGIHNFILRAGQKGAEPVSLSLIPDAAKSDGSGRQSLTGAVNDTVNHTLYGRRGAISRRYLVFVATVRRGNPLGAFRQSGKGSARIVCQRHAGCYRRASAAGGCTSSKYRAVAKY